MNLGKILGTATSIYRKRMANIIQMLLTYSLLTFQQHPPYAIEPPAYGGRIPANLSRYYPSPQGWLIYTDCSRG
jgi:hypothetical protein